MAGKIVSKKITKIAPEPAPEKEVVEVESEQGLQQAPAKKKCFFCKTSTKPSYTDTASLRRYTNDRSKIVARARTGVCSKHQRIVSVQIKYARHLSLLPFIPKL